MLQVKFDQVVGQARGWSYLSKCGSFQISLGTSLFNGGGGWAGVSGYDSIFLDPHSLQGMLFFWTPPSHCVRFCGSPSEMSIIITMLTYFGRFFEDLLSYTTRKYFVPPPFSLFFHTSPWGCPFFVDAHLRKFKWLVHIYSYNVVLPCHLRGAMKVHTHNLTFEGQHDIVKYLMLPVLNSL